MQHVQEESGRQRKYKRELELAFRRKMDAARDQEFAQVRKNERRRINQLPFWSRASARTRFEEESIELERLRQIQSEALRRQWEGFAA
ncbi:hypothetical protein MMC28_011735 [Mycoblastus sanguinarius]|nr:hypothetical protein [Mycoblastus sanguinarius]